MAFEPTKGRRVAHRALSLALGLAIIGQPLVTAAAFGQDAGPSGTMLLPMTPKLDLNTSHPMPPSVQAEGDSILPSPTKAGTIEAGELSTDINAPPPKQAGATTSDDGITEDTTLKGTVQIVADDTEFDQDKNTFLGTGNAVCVVAGQDSKLEADTILYNQNDQTIDARGNVKILRNGNLTTGSKFKFKVTSDEYIITNPDTEIQGSLIVARAAHGIKSGVDFHNGNLTLREPVLIQRNVMWGPISFKDDAADMMKNPTGFVPNKQGFKFTAKKMVYERYKEDNNLTMFGAAMKIGDFNIPLGKVVTTMSKDSKVTMAVTPMISNNLQSGGVNFGPRFNNNIGKTGVLSWAPMIQLGGSGANSNSTSGGIGLAGQVAYTNDNMTSHIAWGSVSNLMVADLKYKINKHDKIQLGVNRFLDDGMFGYDRAAYRAEAVDNHGISKIPYMQSLNFRTAAGWMQDNPQLLNQSSTAYAQLYGNQANTVKSGVSAFRVSEQLTGTTSPIFNVGDDKYGVKSFIYGGVAGRGYSTGNFMGLAQLGPVLNLNLNRLRLQTGYTQSQVTGSTPFVFDQFVQGAESCYVSGDVKLHKWLSLGGTYGYNMNQKLAYAKTITAAIGPNDFKVLLSRDMIRGTNRFGFNLLYGQPVKFDQLIMKGSPDAGQAGGI